MIEPKCPHCGTTLEYDVINDSYFCGDKYEAIWSGWCEDCDRDFEWREIYTLTEIANLKEIPKDE